MNLDSRLFSRAFVLCSLPVVAAFGCAANDGLPGAGSGGESATGGSGTGSAAGTGSASNSGGGMSGGAAGTGSTSGVGGTGTGGASGMGCGSADVLCETFDAGALPTGAGWLERSCSNGAYMLGVTAGAGRESTGALVTSNATTGVDSCALKFDISGHERLHVAVLLKITGATPSNQHEVTFFEIGEQANADDPELRIGYRGDNSCSNSGAVYAGWELGATKGPGGEYTGCTGSVPESETWYCVQVSIDQSSEELVADMTINGMDMSYLVHSQPKTDVRGLFDANVLKLGMQSYSGALDGLVIDQVAVSTTPVDCSP